MGDGGAVSSSEGGVPQSIGRALLRDSPSSRLSCCTHWLFLRYSPSALRDPVYSTQSAFSPPILTRIVG